VLERHRGRPAHPRPGGRRRPDADHRLRQLSGLVAAGRLIVFSTVRRSKDDQEGEVNDVRFVKDGEALSLPEATAWCRCRRRWSGCGLPAAARAAGVESRVTAHSGRIGL